MAINLLTVEFQQALIYGNKRSIYALPLVCLKNNKTLNPLLVYSSDSPYINSIPYANIKSIAYDPLTQFYYFTDDLTKAVLRVKENSEPELFLTLDSKISDIAIDIMDRSLYMVTVQGIVAVDMDVESPQQRVVSEDDGVAAFSQLHGQLAVASTDNIVLFSRVGQGKELDVKVDDITPVHLTVDRYNDQLLVASNVEETTVIKMIDYASQEVSPLDIPTTANASLNLIAADSKSYFVPVAGGVAVFAKDTLKEEHVITTGIEGIVDMVVSYYAPEGNYCIRLLAFD